MKPKIFYHISKKDLGAKVKLLPLDSNDPRTVDRGGSEPDVSRICVAPTIAGCLGAILLCPKKHYIYRTVKQKLAKNPYGVADAKNTGEKWLIKPTVFIKIGIISYNTMIQIMNQKENDGFCFYTGEASASDLIAQSKFIRWLSANFSFEKGMYVIIE